MTTHTLSAGQNALHLAELGNGANPDFPIESTDTVVFPQDVYAVRVRNESGNGKLFVTIDGTVPQPDGINGYTLDAPVHSELVLHPPATGNGVTLKIRRVQQGFIRGANRKHPGSNRYETQEYGRARVYSVEALLEQGDAWPAPPRVPWELVL